ncbi:DNA polymerase III subunit alpha [Arsenophonus sp.]|uniref:DNA polymerase III subunit alpha n=1 Tax=Arsenophonus sp. TaxID=1872640 RepID=UPI0028631FB8|nr:DNA polymerase III subunit alpha [Arsenophonus sp.]MDR5617806.1 DNA polymerase III subunit alpha [Arsenophonus sp.]
MAEPRFIHLRVHSDYSVMDGLAKMHALVNQVKKLGMPALAITDFTNLYGLIKFYVAAHKAGIKPIIGADFYVESDLVSDEYVHLTILAKNNTGYHNLTLLISAAYQKGYNSSIGPTIKQEWLVIYKEGLLLLSGGCMGDVGKLLLRRNYQLVEKCLNFYQTYFLNNYYLELIRTGNPDEENYVHAAIQLATKHSIPVVATNNVRFINSDDFAAHEIRVAIHSGFSLSNPKRPKNYSPQQYLRSEQEMIELFTDIPEALKNSVEIAKRCNVMIRLGKYFLPKFPTGNMATEDFLIECAKTGLEQRLKSLYPNEIKRTKLRIKYDQRLDTELQVINRMGFPGYFLIVMEFIKWSKANGIPVGPGRGSGAGSLVAYALKITELDPIQFDLLFERFLNPERISMPDFDIDFCMEKRDQVIEHVAQMYGRDAVSQIITFGTMAAKAVIRDVGRVLGHPYGFVDRISKLVPLDPGMTLEKAFVIEPQLQEIYNSDEEVKELIDTARKLEGVIRNASKHAGGVVIAPTKITDFAPLYCDPEGQNPLTQFDKNDIEHAGLVKFDFLGLRTLTIISCALKMINQRLIKKKYPYIDIATISLHDQKCFNLLQSAETTAVFQLESRGMKDLIKRLRPDCFEDIIALIALFRPGPLQSGMVDNFINRKHGREVISYPDIKWQHQLLKSVLEPTYGIILYQEQVMQIAQVIAGYTLGEADMLRRAMGKKKPEEMAKQRSIFKKGALKNGIDGKLSMKIFDLVEKFAGYGFNKSHSAAYALVSYQTLWLKTYYPAEFMAAVMTADMDNTEKIVALVDECWRMGLKVLPPDINSGLYQFHVNKNGEIVYGIGAIKGVGEGLMEAIIQSRKQGGSFKEIFDFCTRVDTKKLNRRVMEKLIMSGSCDHLGSHRAALMSSLDDALKAAEQHTKAESIGQIDMFGVLSKYSEQADQSRDSIAKWPENIIFEGERETLGLYLTGHPITAYLSEIKRYTNGLRLKDVNPTPRGQMSTVVGLVLTVKVVKTKRGQKIVICTLDDRSGRLDIILFSDTLKKYQHLLESNKILIATGHVIFDSFNGRNKMPVRELIDLSEARKKYLKRIIILLTDNQINNPVLNRIYGILKCYRAGTIPVYLYYQKKDVKLKSGIHWHVAPTNNLLTELRTLLGHHKVELEFD